MPPRPAPADTPVDDLVATLRDSGTSRGDPVGLAVAPGVGAGLATASGCWAVAEPDLATLVSRLAQVEAELRPRWVWWSSSGTASALVVHDLHPATCWDVAAVHRLLLGGVQDSPATVWAHLHDLDPAAIPHTGQLDLLSDSSSASHQRDQADDDPDDVVEHGTHLRPDWADGGWARTPARAARWARAALESRGLQVALLAGSWTGPPGLRTATAHAESAAELLCVELAQGGLPLDVTRAEELIADSVGPRPRDGAHEAQLRRARDELVLRHLAAGDGHPVDLRNPAAVRSALARAGLDLPDTRSWRLEPWRGHHPLVDALLTWRKADRVGTTYGYGWLDRHVGPDGRLRGAWSGSDGAAGRMTAQAGLHNLPAELRPAVAAEPGHVFVRADLGQIEPRVLAAVSHDPALAAATRDDDLYAPVAGRLGVERPVAKIAVLAAMYGQTSGTAGQALAGLERAYPVAMRYLNRAYDEGRAGRSVRTYGGRTVRMWAAPVGLDEDGQRAREARWGRYARNAVVQGSAAELFKAWAVTVRTLGRPLGAEIVLCLHDELLVHAPRARADDVAELLHSSLTDVGRRWTGTADVRFVADVRVVERWSDAKD